MFKTTPKMTMRDLLSTIFFLWALLSAIIMYPQGIVNNGASIVLDNNPYIYIDGDANGGFTNLGVSQIISEGTISLEGNWINNGLTNAFINTTNIGTTSFTGTTLQEIGGSHITDFDNLTMNNSGPGAFISINQQIEFTLTMTDGDLDLRDYDIQLVNSASTISSETTLKRIKATDGITDGQGTGTIYTIRDNPNGNIANLGLSLNLIGNNITISRGHLVQSGTGTFAAGNSVFRYYEIFPVANGGGGNTVTFNDCYTPELNSHNPSLLIMYQWMEENNSGIEYWHPIPDNNSGAPVPLTQTLDLATLNYIKVTLGSEANPLPINLVEFEAVCNSNLKTIKWTTSSEQNSDYYELFVSENGINYQYLKRINAAGNSNHIINYSFADYSEYNSDLLYYKLIQFDYNKNSHEYITTASNCIEQIPLSLDLINNPANNYSVLNIKSPINQTCFLSFYNNLGQEMIKKIISLNENSNIITINTSNLSVGFYYIILNSNKEVVTKQILINR